MIIYEEMKITPEVTMTYVHSSDGYLMQRSDGKLLFDDLTDPEKDKYTYTETRKKPGEKEPTELEKAAMILMGLD